MTAVVDGVNCSQEKARDTSQVIEQIVQEITVSAEANNRISTISRVQMENIVLLQDGLDRLFETFKENSAKVETTATIGDDLYRVSESLKGQLAQFIFEHDEEAESSYHDKRTNPRLDRHLRVHVTQNNKAYESICRDFSMTGMRLRTKDRLDPKAKLQLSVYLPYDNLSDYGSQVPLKLQGEIMWQNPEDSGYVSGVQFTELVSVQRQQLQTCFRHFNRQSQYANSPARSARV